MWSLIIEAVVIDRRPDEQGSRRELGTVMALIAVSAPCGVLIAGLMVTGCATTGNSTQNFTAQTLT